MVTFRLMIPGRVVPKARPRVVNRRTYTPESTVEYERAVAFLARASRQAMIESGPVSVELSITRKRPKRRGAEYPIGKPDIDNEAKAVLDALNGIAYRDDGQIVALHVSRVYGDEASAEIVITEVSA